MANATGTTKKNSRLKPKRARLLETRTPVAVRRMARAFLAAACRARHRLHKREDEEALHDFRVALRRLRSMLRIYRPAVGTRLVPPKWRRRLKRLARATGDARDAEVGLLWLLTQTQQATGAERDACDRLIETWSARRDSAYAKLRRVLDKEFASIDAGVRQALTAPAPLSAAPLLASTAGGLMRDQIAELRATLHCIKSVSDTKTIHAARIDAKRLRYLLEPFAREIANGKALLASLKKFQDDFGELCDRQVFSEEVVAAAAACAAERGAQALRSTDEKRTLTPPDDGKLFQGLRKLTGRLDTERKHCYERVEKRYLGPQADVFLAPYRALADRLTRMHTGPKPRARTAKAHSRTRISR